MQDNKIITLTSLTWTHVENLSYLTNNSINTHLALTLSMTDYVSTHYFCFHLQTETEAWTIQTEWSYLSHISPVCTGLPLIIHKTPSDPYCHMIDLPQWPAAENKTITWSPTEDEVRLLLVVRPNKLQWNGQMYSHPLIKHQLRVDRTQIYMY